MRFSTILILLTLLFCKTGSSQSVLDGVYMKTPRTQIYKSNFHYDLCNSQFCLHQEFRDSIPLKLDCNVCNQYSRAKAPLKINDCVYFNPAEKYVCNYSLEKSKEFYFFLNAIDSTENSPGDLITPNENILPNSLRFYLDSSQVETFPSQLQMVIQRNASIPFDKYLRPFYFRKYEVTNKEYREFCDWVRDSIARDLLYSPEMRTKMNDKPINWNDPNTLEDLAELYLPKIKGDKTPKEFDSRRLNYQYEVNGKKVIVNIYPDTASWTRDFDRFFTRPLADLYFAHPAYNEYPVVGVNYHQALAYLNWRTKKEQQLLDKQGVRLKIDYDLPNEIEWDVAATSEIKNKKVSVYTRNYYSFSDNSWITDLLLTDDVIIKTDSIDTKANKEYINTRENVLTTENQKHFAYISSYGKPDEEIDEAYFPEVANWSRIRRGSPLQKTNEDETGICFMGGNLSEWLKDSYKENWKPLFAKRQALLKSFHDADTDLLAATEAYYDSKNDPDGRLVRGGNWFDERFSDKLGKNTEGINAKLFVNPDSAHCTLGFRYVIHFTNK